MQMGVAALGMATASAPGAEVWLRAALPGVQVYSDASQHNVAEFALQYAAFLQSFNAIIAPPGRHGPPETVVLFRRLSTLQSYASTIPAEQRDSLIELRSDFDEHAVSALALDRDRYEALFDVYEGDAFWQLRGLGYFLPLAVRQGTAEYFATFELKGDECILGEGDERYQAPLAGGGLLPWDKFFSIDENSPEYGLKGHSFTGAYHAQCWKLMHAVLTANDAAEAQARFRRLADLIYHSPSYLAAFASFFQTTPSRLDWAMGGLNENRRVRLPFDRAGLESKLRIESAPEADVRAQLYDLLVNSDRLAAEVQLDRAVALAPRSAAVKIAEAHQALRSGDRLTAAQDYRDAIAAGAQDPSAYFHSAVQRLDDALAGSGGHVGTGGDDAVAAVAELHHCLALMPGYSQAYAELGRAYLAVPHVDRSAIADLKPALADPGLAPMIHYYIGILYRRLGDRASAKATFTAMAGDQTTAERFRLAAQAQLAAIAEAGRPAPRPPAVTNSPPKRIVEETHAPPPPPPPIVLDRVSLRLASREWNTYSSYVSDLMQKVQDAFQAPNGPHTPAFHGEVAVPFTLSSDGSLSATQPAQSQDGAPPALLRACEQAVQGSAPFAAWGDDMTDALGHEQNVAVVFHF